MYNFGAIYYTTHVRLNQELPKGKAVDKLLMVKSNLKRA